jgi:hypothetical protein
MHGKSHFSCHVGPQIINQLGTPSTNGTRLLPQNCLQADANSYLVDIFPMNVTTFYLSQPSRANLYLAVFGIDPVADDKMVGQSVLHAAPPMCIFVDRRVAILDGAMVANDPLPTPGRDRDPRRLFADVPGK